MGLFEENKIRKKKRKTGKNPLSCLKSKKKSTTKETKELVNKVKQTTTTDSEEKQKNKRKRNRKKKIAS